VDGAGVLLLSPKNAKRSFFMADLGFFGRTCTHLLGCSFQVGVSVMDSLFLAPLPSSIVELLLYSNSSSVLISTSSQEKNPLQI